MAKRGYGDTMSDTPENPRTAVGDLGGGREQLASIRTPSVEERATARRYLERVAPDLVDMLGLA